MNKRSIVIAVSVVFLVIILFVVFLPKNKKNNNGKEAADDASSLEKTEIVINNASLLESKKMYKEKMSETENINEMVEIQKKIEGINMRLIFSPVIDGCSAKYSVVPKDALEKIAKKFRTTVNLIKRANNLSSDVIRPGQELKVNTCKFSIVVDKSQNLLFLERAGEIFKTYVVSTGRDNNTPIGSFKIINKLENPTWYKSGAVIPPDSSDNVLGTRWMGFDLKGYGIHGTTEPENLGKQITLGCVRMKNEEVEELFDIVPVGTEALVVD